MNMKSCKYFFAAVVIFLAMTSYGIGAATTTAQETPATVFSPEPTQGPDADFYTFYQFDKDFQTIYLDLLSAGQRSTQTPYNNYTFGPFGHAGALVEGYATWTGNNVHRSIYIVDVAAGPAGTEVVLHRYRRTDVLSPVDDKMTVVPTDSLKLPLTGGTQARCYMVGNLDFIYIATNQSNKIVRLRKATFKAELIDEDFFTKQITGITTNDYGYVQITGDDVPGYPPLALVHAPGGTVIATGPAAIMATSKTGVTISNLPAQDFE